MPAYLPKFDTKLTITLKASAAITGGRLVEVSGDGTVAQAAADSTKVVGVAMDDAAENQTVAVSLGGVQRLLANGSITAGDEVAAAADGKAKTGDSAQIGVALSTGDSTLVTVLLNR